MQKLFFPSTFFVWVLLLFLSLAPPVFAGGGESPGGQRVSPRCEAAMDKAAGAYARCLLKAKARFAKQGDGDRLFLEEMRCDDKFDAQVARAQARFGEEACTPYASEIAGRAAACTEEVATLAGGDATLFSVGQAERPYTWNFVDSMENAARRWVPPQPAPSSQSGFDCKWSIDGVAGPEEKSFACAMKLKYDLALLTYDLYAVVRVAHDLDPLDPGKNLLLRHMNYIVGLAGYWELGVAKLDTTVLAPACEGTVTDWRTAAPYIEGNKASVYFPALTSTLGDLLLGLLTAFFHQTLGIEAALYWGAYQEAFAQPSIENNLSGWFFNTDLDPRGPIEWRVTPAGQEAYQYPQSFLPQMVWLTLPVDILVYDGIPDLERLRVEEKGRQYMDEFENRIYPSATPGGEGMTLLEATREMVALMDQKYPDCSSGGVLAEWVDVLLPIGVSLFEGGDLSSVLPQAVDRTEGSMALAIALTEKLQEELDAFVQTGGPIDPYLKTENGEQSVDICSLYDGPIESLPLLNRMSCVSP